MRRKLKARLYAFIRPLFVKRVDINEDYECMSCREPVLQRDLFCSDRCREYARAEGWWA